MNNVLTICITICVLGFLVSITSCSIDRNHTKERLTQIYKEQNLSPLDVECAEGYSRDDGKAAICAMYVINKAQEGKITCGNQ
jgi:hypothetical protein